MKASTFISYKIRVTEGDVATEETEVQCRGKRRYTDRADGGEE